MVAPIHSDVHPADGVLHGGAEATRPEVELITDAILGTAVVDDLFDIWPVAPTSRLHLVRGRRATADFLEQCHGFGVRRVATVLQHR
jgi:hypothetical protein